MHKNPLKGDFPGGPLGKNPSRNAGDVGLIPGRGTSIPLVMELSLWATTRESTKKDPMCCNKDQMQSNKYF